MKKYARHCEEPEATKQSLLKMTGDCFVLLATLGVLAMTTYVITVGTAEAKSIGNGTIKVELNNDALNFDDHIITLQRTLRIPDDGKEYPLPPSLGRFPIYKVSDYKTKVPKDWVEEGGVFIPMYQREAMWISFGGEEWRPRAVKIGVGSVNALTGEPWDLTLKKIPEQNYLVAPVPQPWIDGIKTGKNTIRQFVAMPLGSGFTVSEQVNGEASGGLKIAVFNPKKGKFKKPKEETHFLGLGTGAASTAPTFSEKSEKSGGAELGLAAGGLMTQKIYPDPYGLETWDNEKFGSITIHIVNSEQFEKITGEKPPASPITKKDYEEFHHPWFALYDEEYADIQPQEKLKKVKSVRQLEKEKGIKKTPDEESMKVKKTIKYKMPPTSPQDQEKRQAEPSQ